MRSAIPRKSNSGRVKKGRGFERGSRFRISDGEVVRESWVVEGLLIKAQVGSSAAKCAQHQATGTTGHLEEGPTSS